MSIATPEAGDTMKRLSIILTFLVSLFASVPAYAEMAMPHLGGTGPTDYLSKLAMPPVDGLMLDPRLDMPPPVPNGRMAMSPGLLEARAESLRMAQRAKAMQNFWTYIAIFSGVFLGGTYLLGRQVQKRGWKVGYTRKTHALMLYFLPYIAMQGPSPYSWTTTATIALGVFILLLMLMSAPIRNRVPIIATAFACIDRPEDRPFTLTWLITSVIAVWGIIIVWYLAAPETVGYMFVAFFISGIGDALAEPVGLYFGRHSYETKALGTDRTYIRTWEGSATVFVSGVVAVVIAHDFALDAKGLAALALFPIVGALAEARSPHTWDQPFIIASCALVSVGLSFL